MNETIGPDEAIAYALENGAQGISLGLAKQLQAERNQLKHVLRRWSVGIQWRGWKNFRTLEEAIEYIAATKAKTSS